MYVPPLISSFTLSVGTVEIGATVTDVTATWAFNKEMTAAALTDTAISPADTTYAFTGLSLTSNKTYTLTCNDGVNTTSSSKTISFSHKRYWGASPSSTLDNAEILVLSSEFSTSKAKTVTYDCTGGKYPYLCYPAAWGLPSGAVVNGFLFSDYSVTILDFVNTNGHTESFNVVRFNTVQNGAAVSVVWS